MTKRDASHNAALLLALVSLVSIPSYSQNQILGEVQFVGKTEAEKTSGVWIDGQYVGYAGELKDDKKCYFCLANMRFPCATPVSA